MIERLTDILHREGCSCVIGRGDDITLCHNRGVADLYRLLSQSPATLDGAAIADKVVGKGAAALMVSGNVAEVYADVMSKPALALLEKAGVPTTYGLLVDNIINRAGTGICPVETLCMHAHTAAECIPLIERFLATIKSNPK